MSRNVAELSILGMGYAHPTGVITNDFLEKLEVGTTAQWITEKIGIQNRRTSLPLDYISKTRNQRPHDAIAVATDTPMTLGVRAAKMALEKSGITAADIGLIIVNACTPCATSPTESHRLAEALGIKGQVYDVFTACPVFALHMDYLGNFDSAALPDYILCVSTATLTQHVNYNDRSDGAIWGDGAGAWVVSPRKPGKLKVIDSTFHSDPSRSQAVVVDTWGHFKQDGRAVRDFSVRQTVRLVKRMEEEFKLDWSKDVFIGHQANLTMLQQITGNREIPDHNHWYNVTDIGNQAGAGAPIVLAMNWERIVSGQRIAVAVVGAGLSWGSVLLEAN
jgi:3-oxoacyl-[acyl-carrier-protein] synthase-3